MLLLLFATPAAVEPPASPDTSPFWYGGEFAGLNGALVFGVLADYVYTEIFGRSGGAARTAQSGGAGRPVQGGSSMRATQYTAARRPKQ